MPHPRNQRNSANAEFRQMMEWIALAAIAMVAAALAHTAAVTELSLRLAIAMIAGVIISVILGSGIFALAFFSNMSGHDQAATDASGSQKQVEDGGRAWKHLSTG